MVELNNHKEKTIVDLEHYKDILDKTLKSITHQFDINEKSLKEFSKNSSKLMEAMLKEEVKNFNKKIDDVKLENGKYHLETRNMIKELKESLDDTRLIKNELKELWEAELETVKGYHNKRLDALVCDIARIDVEIRSLNTNFKV